MGIYLIEVDTQGLNIPFMDGERTSFDEQSLKRRCGVSIDYSKGSFMNFIYAVVQLASMKHPDQGTVTKLR